MKSRSLLLTFFTSFTTAAALPAAAQHIPVPRVEKFSLSAAEADRDTVVKKIALAAYAAPVVTVASATYESGVQMTVDAASATMGPLPVVMGMERSQPFALVKIPTAMSGAKGRLNEVTLSVVETVSAPPPLSLKTTATSSVLADGDWYKISVPDRGMYRVDYAFLSSNGILSGAVSSSAVRLFGNGGAMLSEAVGAARIDDLAEVAVEMHDGGDGSFGSGDYFIFYAPGHTAWQWDASSARYLHRKNIYEDRSHYFVRIGGAGRRISPQGGAPASNVTVSSFDEYTAIDNDNINVGSFGRQWFGDDFGSSPGKVLTHSYTIPTPGLQDSLRSRVVTAIGYTRSTDYLAFSLQGEPVYSASFFIPSYSETAATDQPFDSGIWTNARPFSGTQATFDFNFQASTSASRGYVDFIELNWRRALQYSGSPLHFRDRRSAGSGRVGRYELGGASGAVQVWDVTDATSPVGMSAQLSGGTLAFAREADAVREFVAFDGATVTAAPSFVGKISRQNLHGQTQQDYLIITNSKFRAAADELAVFHREKRGLRVLVATVDQIYNEFSSGSQDISAIRDFARMFYARANGDTTQMPRYLLMFGDASYDYKDRVTSNTNYVPTYEAANSEIHVATFAGDDFFALLDGTEDINSDLVYNTLDVGIGRLPVKTLDEANGVVQKIKRYAGAESLGPWRLSVMYVGDNGDGAGDHLMNSEACAKVIDATSPLYADTKVYLDNIPFVSTPGGMRAPNANKAINDGIYRGVFLMNYSGHGSPNTLSHERVLTAEDYNAWKNSAKLPIMVTATCDFTAFDQPSFVSAGEALVLKPDGGSIAMLTTTHAVYAPESLPLNENFLAEQFKQHADGSWSTFGDALRMGKNQLYSRQMGVGAALNSRKFILMADPALLPAMPRHVVQTDAVKDMNTGEIMDTIKALGGYTIDGSVHDHRTGALLSGFNGRVYVTIYDKPRVVNAARKVDNQIRTFQTRSNIVYKGITTATAGRFSFSFIAPKDLNYEMGSGRVLYYAENGETDAAGSDTAVRVGGFSDNPVVENNPPSVRPYINDSLFRNGGLTGSNTMLYVILEDETGINVSGNAVGHDMTAVLDGAAQDPFILNDYYETAPNTYRRGYVRFPITDLADGKHNLRVKAWDVNNNSGEGTVTFEVADGAITRVQSLMCYPNPFRNQTRFVWEHNLPEQEVRAEIHIYSTAGMLIRRLSNDFTPTGSRTAEMTWDGTSDGGAALPAGVYLYRLVFTGPSGTSAGAYEKVVLLR